MVLSEALVQQRRPAAQHDLGERDRERNVGLYRLRSNAAACLLIDDLITTGATVRSAGKCLRRAGCRTIHVACLARAPQESTNCAAPGTLVHQRNQLQLRSHY